MSSTEFEIELEFTPEIDDVRRIVLSQRKYIFFGLGFVFCLLLMGAIVFGILALTDLSDNTHAQTALTMLTVLPFVAGLAFWDWWKAKKLARELLTTAEETVYRLNQNGLRADSKSGHLEWEWVKFFKVKETAGDFLFFTQRNLNFPIAKRAFNSAEDIAHLRSVLTEKLGAKAALLKS